MNEREIWDVRVEFSDDPVRMAEEIFALRRVSESLWNQNKVEE